MDKDSLDKILKNFLDEKNRLVSYPSKRKMKGYALLWLSKKFEYGKIYTEKEVNHVLNTYTVFDDPATLRREMFNYRIFDRKSDGSAYWLEEVQPTAESLGLTD